MLSPSTTFIIWSRITGYFWRNMIETTSRFCILCEEKFKCDLHPISVRQSICLLRVCRLFYQSSHSDMQSYHVPLQWS